MLSMIEHSLMVYAPVYEVYIHFTLIYTADHILQVLTIEYLIKKYGEPTTPFKLATGMKSSISNFRVLFCPCVVQKDTAHVGTNELNMYQQAQKSFRGTFVGIPQHQKGYLV